MSFYVGTILRFPQQRFSAAREKKRKEGEKNKRKRRKRRKISKCSRDDSPSLLFSVFHTFFFSIQNNICQISACDPGDWHDIGAHQFFVATNSTFHFARNQQETKTLKTLPPCNEKKNKPKV